MRESAHAHDLAKMNTFETVAARQKALFTLLKQAVNVGSDTK
jgi:hypothetical protein